MLPFVQRISLLILSLILSGCGFHLKHDNSIIEKFPTLYIQSNNPNGELTRFIKIRLRGAGIKIATSPTKYITTLKIISEKRSSRTISLYVNAQKAESEMGYNMNYSVQIPNLEVKNFSINLYRDFLDNPAQALAKSREAELLTTELRGIAAEHVISTLSTLKL